MGRRWLAYLQLRSGLRGRGHGERHGGFDQQLGTLRLEDEPASARSATVSADAQIRRLFTEQT